MRREPDCTGQSSIVESEDALGWCGPVETTTGLSPPPSSAFNPCTCLDNFTTGLADPAMALA